MQKSAVTFLRQDEKIPAALNGV